MGVIRLLLAFAVFTHHAAVMDGELLPGVVSVRLFFMVSGFYMALILDERYGRDGLWLFYSNRALRLFPAYLAVAAASLAMVLLFDAHAFMSRDDLFAAWAEAPAVLVALALSNLAVTGQDILFLLDFGEGFGPVLSPCADCPVLGFSMALVPQAWSVALELWFYLSAPLLVRLRARTLLALGAASLVLHAALSAGGVDGANAAHHLFPAQLHLFLAGVLSHRLYRRFRGLPQSLGLCASAVLCAAIVGYRHLGDPWRFPLLALLLAGAMPLVFGAMRHRRWDRFLGDLSYPFYLVQFLVIALADRLTPELGGPGLTALALAGAVVLYLAVDRPVSRLRRRRLRAAPPVPRTAAPERPVPLPAA